MIADLMLWGGLTIIVAGPNIFSFANMELIGSLIMVIGWFIKAFYRKQ